MATVNFIRNSNQSGSAMGATIRYVERDDKTRGKQFVSGQNCAPQLAEQEFLTTRTVNRKNGGRWFYHYTQSFSPQENVTPELAHEIAKEFAARAWPDSEVVIATHVDAAHIHSHFVLNAVCFETGRMLRQHPDTLQKLRAISDELCMAHGLSILPSQKREQKSNGVSAREYRSAVKGESWKFQLMAAVDDCMRRARTREEFIERMERAGYGVRWEDARANITYTTPSGMKCRDKRLHEKKYRKENMEDEFKIRAEILAGRTQADEQPRPDDGERGRAVHHADRPELDGGVEPAGTPVYDAPANHGGARYAVDEAGRRNAAPADRAGDADATRRPERGGRCVRATGWESERVVFLRCGQAGFDYGNGIDLADALDAGQSRRDAAQDGVSDRSAVPEHDSLASDYGDRLYRGGDAADDPLRGHYAAATSIGAALGLAAALDGDDSDDAEERRRKIQAREVAENLGAAIGLAAGVALVIAEKRQQKREQAERIQQQMEQTM